MGDKQRARHKQEMLRFKSKELSFIISVWYFRKQARAESNLHKRYPGRQRLGRNPNLGSFQSGCWGSVPAVTSTAQCWPWEKQWFDKREKKAAASAQPLAGTKCTGQSNRTGATSFLSVWAAAGEGFKLCLQHAVSGCAPHSYLFFSFSCSFSI